MFSFCSPYFIVLNKCPTNVLQFAFWQKVFACVQFGAIWNKLYGHECESKYYFTKILKSAKLQTKNQWIIKSIEQNEYVLKIFVRI